MHLERLGQLQQVLSRVDNFIRAGIAHAQSTGDNPTDTLRGLVVSADEVESYLNQAPLERPQHLDGLPPLLDSLDEFDTLAHLTAVFNLELLDIYILLLCLAPEFDRRYERFYAYLQDDISERRPSVNLMMNLLGQDMEGRFAVLQRLQPTQPLRKYALLDCIPDSRSPNGVFLAYQVKADYRLVAYLLGEDEPDARLRRTVQPVAYEPDVPLPEIPIQTIQAAMLDAPLIYMQGKVGMGETETAAALCAAYGLGVLKLDLAGMNTLELQFDLVWHLALREGYLGGRALLLDNWESCLSETRQPPAAFWEALLEYPFPIFLHGQGDWEPLDTVRHRRMLRMTFTVPDFPARYAAWENLISLYPSQVTANDLEELASKFRFTRTQIARAVHSAADQAASRGEPLRKTDLYMGSQAHTSLRLGHLAQRITPRFGWEHLILPPDPITQLREIADRLRYAHVVNEEWGFRAQVGMRGVSALFAGESGTGKTLAAEVIARELGLVMYRVDLSAVVSKYIGETEKNLNTIFSAAESADAILFFDEADALFGKRSEVKDARDRYANIEIAYLLQQVEEYDGLVVLATNFRQNIDEAFTRRLDFLIDFPFPDDPYRHKIWTAHFPANAPLGAEVDLAEIASRYRLTGGNIRNAAMAAAYLAAADGRVITSAHIRSAIRREHQKMGRLLDD